MHHHEYENRTVYDKYTYFEAILPDSNDFEIPSYCQEIAPTRKQAGVASRNLWSPSCSVWSTVVLLSYADKLLKTDAYSLLLIVAS